MLYLPIVRVEIQVGGSVELAGDGRVGRVQLEVIS